MWRVSRRRRAELEKRAHDELQDAHSRATALAGLKLTMTAKAGSEGKPVWIGRYRGHQRGGHRGGHRLARSEVRLSSGPLRTVGEHAVQLHLHTDVDVQLNRGDRGRRERLSAAGAPAMNTPLRARGETRTPPSKD